MKNLKLITATSLLALCASSAAAHYVYSGEMVTCQGIENNVERITCYDNIDLSGPEEEPSPEAPPLAEVETPESVIESATAWTLREDTDPISGTNTSRAYIDADQTLNGPNSPEYIMMRCDGEGGYELFIGTNGYIGSRQRIAVQYRWNDDEPIDERWADSTNGKAAFLPNGYNDFKAGLIEGGELAFRWSDFNGSRTASIWNNIQIDENAQFIIDGCQS